MQRLSFRWFLIFSFVATLGLASCTEGRVQVRGTAQAAPMLVEVAPGVWVVEDYDRPVFYDQGYYWLYDDGYWYQSPYLSGSWLSVRSHVVPGHLRSIQRPHRYRHYRSDRQVRRRHAPTRVRRYRGDREYRRSDREYRRSNREYRGSDRRPHDRSRRTPRRTYPR